MSIISITSFSFVFSLTSYWSPLVTTRSPLSFALTSRQAITFIDNASLAVKILKILTRMRIHINYFKLERGFHECYPFCESWSFAFTKLLSSSEYQKWLVTMSQNNQNINSDTEDLHRKVWRPPSPRLISDTRIFSK